MPRKNSKKPKDSLDKTSWIRDYGAAIAALAILAVLFAIIAGFAQPSAQPNANALPPTTKNPWLQGAQQQQQQSSPSSQTLRSAKASQAELEQETAADQRRDLAAQYFAKAFSFAEESENARAMLARNASVSAYFINATRLNELAAKHPVVYAGLGGDAQANGVVEIQFSARAKTLGETSHGLLVIVGVDADGAPTRVLREFPVIGLNLNS
jgi:hypothetical protein